MNPKGSKTKMDPIRNLKDIRTILQLLEHKPRDYCLFMLGINTALRGSDLLNIEAGQVRHLKPGDDWEPREQKTGKDRRITFNKACHKAVKKLLDSQVIADHEKLIQGQRGPMRVETINHMVKAWCKQIKLKGNFGSHTLRKTFGYHQRVTHGASIPQLMETFGHATPKQTLTYLCIQDEEIKSIYMNEIC